MNFISTRRTAQILVDKTPYAIDKPYDYLIPEGMDATLTRGCRVLVPFGNSNKKVQGLVIGTEDAVDWERRLKPVAVQLDPKPFVSEEQFHIIRHLIRSTFCSGYEAVRAVLPTGANVEAVETYRLVRRPEGEELSFLSAEEQRVVEFFSHSKTTRELADFLDYRGNPAKAAVVLSLMKKGLLEKTDVLKSRVAKKTVRMVRLNPDFASGETRLSKKQEEIAALLRETQTAMVKELCYLCGVTEAVVRAMVKRGVLLPFEREAEQPFDPLLPPTGDLDGLALSRSQQDAYEGIRTLLENGKPAAALLYGVTGSGKTQVYIKLIEAVLTRGKTAMLLVPEISLTSQMVERFRALFGGVVAVIHSSLSMAERFREDERIRAGRARIVIGTRSAVFAPLQKIGLIILDEEGETSYKSDSAPRYHAREIAKLRCGWHNAVLLLGSATPSVDSYYRAQKGGYRLFTLEERYADAALPQVYLVDRREEPRQNLVSPISGILQEQLARNLQNGEQSILLINRRGYNTYATCLQCGTVLKCPDCSVAMTYHKANGRLMCHCCGHTELFSPKCPECGGEYLKLTGVGTQKLENELELILPKARLLRMDTDTTFSRGAYEKNFEAFRQGEYDILLGTQMIAKGLDFPNVTLVGVVNADSGLYSADYRSGERIFSLITQVVGRSGRSGKAGRAYIQTYEPENPVIAFAAKQDFPAFYADEIASRKALVYPPFCDIVLLGFAGMDEGQAGEAARIALDVLREEASAAEGVALRALGVTPATISKIAGKYRYRILMKCRLNEPFRELLARVLRRCGTDKRFAGITIWADVNGEIG